MKALIISADHFEDTELLVPYYRLKEEGFEVDVASISRGKINGKHGYEVSVDKAFATFMPKTTTCSFCLAARLPQRCARNQPRWKS